MITKLAGRVLVYDLEYTSWEDSVARRWSGPGEHREIVQIGAVALDADQNFRELGALELLVKPRINPDISDYLSKLTGIAASEVIEHGIDFAEALARFREFSGSPGTPLLSFGPDFLVLRENCGLIGADYPFGGGQECNRPVAKMRGFPRTG